MLDLDATNDPIHGDQLAASSTAITKSIASFLCTSFVVIIYCVLGCVHRISMPAPGPCELQRIIARFGSLAQREDPGSRRQQILP